MAVNIREAKTILREVVLKTSVVPMLWGPRGVGKTRLVTDLAAELGYEVVVVRIGQMEVGDLIGMPYIEEGRTMWARPAWWPADDAPPTIVFLDELNRVTDRGVVDSIMQLVLDRRLHTHVLADQHRIVCAGNPPADGYNVADLDDAAMSRMLHLYIKNPVETWGAWAEGRISRDIIEFVMANQNLLAPPDNAESAIKIAPNHRAYEMLNEIYTQCELSEEAMYVVASGLLGKEAAVVFSKFMRERYTRPVSGREVLENYAKVRKRFLVQRERLDLLNATCTDIVAFFQAASPDGEELRISEDDLARCFDNLTLFLGDLPRDSAVALVSAIDEIEPVSKHLALHEGVYEFLRLALTQNTGSKDTAR